VIADKFVAKFADLLNFNEIEKLPARIFDKLIQSNRLHIDEEYQVVNIIQQYVKTIDKDIEAL